MKNLILTFGMIVVSTFISFGQSQVQIDFCINDTCKDFEFVNGMKLIGVGSEGEWGDSKKYGFMNRKGELVVDCIYDYAEKFYNGYAIVGILKPPGVKMCSLARTGKKYRCSLGFIDSTGRLIIPCQYDFARNFSEGYAAVGLLTSGEDRDNWFHIDTKGNRLYSESYGDAWDFIRGYAIVDLDAQYHRSHINKQGMRIYSQTYLYLYPFNEYGKALCQKIHNNSSDLFVVINTRGEELASAWYNFSHLNAENMPLILKKALGP